jgi:hypothetical protein
MPLQPVALADTYRNISLKQNSDDSSFATLTANAVIDTLTLVAGPGISFSTGPNTIEILNDFGDENATISIRALLVDNISIDTNVIQITESNANLELRANGSGEVYVNDALTVENSIIAKSDLEIQGSNITTTTSIFNLLNTTATTVNFASDATVINLGAANGTLTIGNEIITGTNATSFDMNGANPSINSTNTGTASVFDSNITTGNLFGSAATINIGNNFTLTNISGSARLGNLTVDQLTTFKGPVTAQNDVIVYGSLNLTGDINGGPLRTDDIQIVGNRIETTVSNSNLELNTVGLGNINLLADTNISGNLLINSQLTLTDNSISTISDNSNLTLTAHGTGRIIVETIIFNANNLDTTDSSGISITPSVTFESDIIAQNGIQTKGHIIPDTDLAYKIGDSSKRFATAYIDRLEVSTDLEVQFGGTGVSTFTANGILFGNSTDPIQVTAASNPGSNAITSYGILTTNASNVPLWTDVIDGGEY